jgi:hypothetical protein
MEQLNISLIRLDGGTQPRAFISAGTVEEYAETLTEGGTLPPVTVFYDGENHWLADGFHRVDAARKNNFVTIDADVIQGTREDAQWFSFGANKAHGLRRTNADKARAVEAALKHPSAATKTDDEIAEHCGVSRRTVLNYKSEHLVKNARDGTKIVTRGGITYQIKTANIGKKKKIVRHNWAKAELREFADEKAARKAAQQPAQEEQQQPADAAELHRQDQARQLILQAALRELKTWRERYQHTELDELRSVLDAVDRLSL